jgi:Zn-finger nucleic acid-binding protein
MMFQGMRFCPHCGNPAAEWQASESGMPCPVCREAMLVGTVGPNRLHECGKCYGIWLDTATFERVCREAERQAVSLEPRNLGQAYVTEVGPVRYRRCPVCDELMNRVNFAQCSGVVVDVCRQHGTWFDRSELQRIVEFVRAGGLDRGRERMKSELAAEVRYLEAVRRSTETGGVLEGRRELHGDLLSVVVGSAGGLLRTWLKR